MQSPGRITQSPGQDHCGLSLAPPARPRRTPIEFQNCGFVSVSLEPGSRGGLLSEEASCPAARGEPGLAAPRLWLLPERAAGEARDGFRNLSLPASLSRGAQVPSCPERGPQNRRNAGGQGGQASGGGGVARTPPPQEGFSGEQGTAACVEEPSRAESDPWATTSLPPGASHSVTSPAPWSVRRGAVVRSLHVNSRSVSCPLDSRGPGLSLSPGCGVLPSGVTAGCGGYVGCVPQPERVPVLHAHSSLLFTGCPSPRGVRTGPGLSQGPACTCSQQEPRTPCGCLTSPTTAVGRLERRKGELHPPRPGTCLARCLQPWVPRTRSPSPVPGSPFAPSRPSCSSPVGASRRLGPAEEAWGPARSWCSV